MKIIECVQGTPDWQAARLGIPTASQMDRVLTPKTQKISSQAVLYRNQLLAEWCLGYPIDWTGQSGWMDRGLALESEARSFYEFRFDREVEEVGFILRDDGKFGGSPDGLVSTDGMLEIKCPAIQTHIGYLLSPADLVAAYRGQAQSLLYVSGRKWLDLIAYNPELPLVVQRVERDEKYIAALASALDRFVSDLDAAKELLTAQLAAEASPEPEDAELLTGVPF